MSSTSSWQYEFDSEAHGVGITGEETITVTVSGTDVAGNIGTKTSNFKVNQLTDVPKIYVNNFSNGDKKFGIFTITGTAEDDDNVKEVWVSIDNTTDWVKASGNITWSYQLDSSPLSNGDHDFYYKSVDIYGKESTYLPGGKIDKVKFKVDPDIPIITFDFENNKAIKSDSSISGTVAKDSGIVTQIEMKLQGTDNTQNWFTLSGANVTGIGTPSATFSYNVDTSVFGEGNLYIYIRAKDDLDKLGDKGTTV